MLARGTLSPSQAYEMSRLTAPLQDELWRLIRGGACDTYARLRASADGLLRKENQQLFEPEPPPTAEEQAALSGLEGLIDKLCTLLARSFSAKEMVLAVFWSAVVVIAENFDIACIGDENRELLFLLGPGPDQHRSIRAAGPERLSALPGTGTTARDAQDAIRPISGRVPRHLGAARPGPGR